MDSHPASWLTWAVVAGSHDDRPPAARPLVIVGAGGFAREVLALVRELGASGHGAWRAAAFLGRDGDPIGGLLDGVPVLGAPAPAEGERPWGIAAIGSGAERRVEVAARAAEVAGWATLVHPSVTFDPGSVRIGEGCIVAAGTSLTCDLELRRHVVLNLHCTVGHDCLLEDYVSVMPGCHLSGAVTLREAAFLGTGAVVLPGVEVGAGAAVGAGAVVTRDVAPGATVVGVPARAVGR